MLGYHSTASMSYTLVNIDGHQFSRYNALIILHYHDQDGYVPSSAGASPALQQRLLLHFLLPPPLPPLSPLHTPTPRSVLPGTCINQHPFLLRPANKITRDYWRLLEITGNVIYKQL